MAGRVVDIGAELFAMSATCAYAAALGHLGDSPTDLADAFCQQSRLRVEELFDRLTDNSDARDRELTRAVLADEHLWLEDGVVDPSVDGPWIAEPPPGPTTRPNLRRTIGRSPCGT